MKPWDSKNNDNCQKKARRNWVVLANDLLAVDFPSVIFNAPHKPSAIKATLLYPFIAAYGT